MVPALISSASTSSPSPNRKRRSFEPSSDASLWDALDDPNQAFASLTTPAIGNVNLPLLSPSSLPLSFSQDNSTMPAAKQLELELFPSIEGAATAEHDHCPSSLSSHSSHSSRTPLAPTSSNISYNAAEMGNPWSQKNVNGTQYMRDEWLISVGLKGSTQASQQNDDNEKGRKSSIDQHANLRSRRAHPSSATPRPQNKVSTEPSSAASESRPAKAAKAASTPRSAKRSRPGLELNQHSSGSALQQHRSDLQRSLADQIDEICGSASSSSPASHSGFGVQPRSSGSSGPAENAARASAPSAMQRDLASDPIEGDQDWDLDEDAEAAILQMELNVDSSRRSSSTRATLDSASTSTRAPPSADRQDHHHDQSLTALEILTMPGSPPSQNIPHIALIKEMPPEKQEIYHRLAFHGSSSTRNSSQPGVTVRGNPGKTWDTTWQNGHGQPGASKVAVSGTRNSTAHPMTSTLSNSRTRKTSSSIRTTTTTSTRGGRSRSKSSSSSSSRKSNYFAKRNFRGRRTRR